MKRPDDRNGPISCMIGSGIGYVKISRCEKETRFERENTPNAAEPKTSGAKCFALSGCRILKMTMQLISKSPITEMPRNAKPSWVPGRLPMSGINLEKENKLTGLGSILDYLVDGFVFA